jgi:hypothetical protein
MSFFRRKAQVRPTISWPVESLRDHPPPSANSTSSPSPTSSHSSRPSDVSTSPSSTTATSLSPSLASFDFQFDLPDHACDLENDDDFARLGEEIEISDDLPTEEILDEAGDIPIYDSLGNVKPFKSLYSGDTAIGEQQLVIFVRHFFCGVSSAIIFLVNNIDPNPTGLSSIPPCPLKIHNSPNILHSTSSNFNHNYWPRLSPHDPLIPQNNKHTLPHLRRPNQTPL